MATCKVCGFDLDGSDCVKCAYYKTAEEEAMYFDGREELKQEKERW